MNEINVNHNGGWVLPDGTFIPDVFIRAGVSILVFYVLSGFLIAMVRMLLNYRLKSKMISRGITITDIEKMLQIGTVEANDYAIKWFLLLLTAGIGLAVIGNFPFGWLSVAVLAFSLSLGFAAYYVYLKYRK